MINVHHNCFAILRPLLHGEKNSKLVPLDYPSYPRRANFFYISLKNLVNRLHEGKKVALTRLVTLAHYSLYKHFGLPSPVKKRQS